MQSWVENSKPAILIRDHGRYLRLDADERAAKLARVEQAAVVAAGADRRRGARSASSFARKSLRQRERMNARGEVLAS